MVSFRFVVFLLFLCLSSCNSPVYFNGKYFDMDEVCLGDSKDVVRNKFGAPLETSLDQNVWYYAYVVKHKDVIGFTSSVIPNTYKLRFDASGALETVEKIK